MPSADKARMLGCISIICWLFAGLAVFFSLHVKPDWLTLLASVVLVSFFIIAGFITLRLSLAAYLHHRSKKSE